MWGYWTVQKFVRRNIVGHFGPKPPFAVGFCPPSRQWRSDGSRSPAQAPKRCQCALTLAFVGRTHPKPDVHTETHASATAHAGAVTPITHARRRPSASPRHARRGARGRGRHRRGTLEPVRLARGSAHEGLKHDAKHRRRPEATGSPVTDQPQERTPKRVATTGYSSRNGSHQRTLTTAQRSDQTDGKASTSRTRESTQGTRAQTQENQHNSPSAMTCATQTTRRTPSIQPAPTNRARHRRGTRCMPMHRQPQTLRRCTKWTMQRASSATYSPRNALAPMRCRAMEPVGKNRREHPMESTRTRSHRERQERKHRATIAKDGARCVGDQKRVKDQTGLRRYQVSYSHRMTPTSERTAPRR